MALSEYSRAYNSFSGADIKAVFNEKPIADLQAMSYSVTREKAPIYTMGSADPRSFSRGKRGIAGTMIFVVFDRHGLLHQMKGAMFLSDIDDVRPDMQGRLTQSRAVSTNLTLGGSAQAAGTVAASQRDVLSAESTLNLEDIASDQELASAWYVDQIPPLDIT